MGPQRLARANSLWQDPIWRTQGTHVLSRHVQIVVYETLKQSYEPDRPGLFESCPGPLTANQARVDQLCADIGQHLTVTDTCLQNTLAHMAAAEEAVSTIKGYIYDSYLYIPLGTIDWVYLRSRLLDMLLRSCISQAFIYGHAQQSRTMCVSQGSLA